MIRGIGKVLQFILALLILAVLTGAVGWLLYESVSKAPGVIAAIVTGLAALLTLIFQRYQERKRDLEQQRRELLAPIYEELIEKLMKAARSEVSEDEITVFFNQLSEKLLLWGPDAIINAYNTWRRASVEEGGPLAAILSVEDLILALRKDLGHDDKNLKCGDLLQVFINIKEYDEELRPFIEAGASTGVATTPQPESSAS